MTKRHGAASSIVVALLLLASSAWAEPSATAPRDSFADAVVARVDPVTDTSVTNGPGVPATPAGFYLGYVVSGANPPDPNALISWMPTILADVSVTAFRRQPTESDSMAIGPAVASVVSSADGAFRLPVLPPGPYVLVFVPPGSLGHREAIVLMMSDSETGSQAWWVALPPWDER